MNHLYEPAQETLTLDQSHETVTAKPSRKAKAADLDEVAFESWWVAYPRRVGKLDARRDFSAAMKAGATVEALQAGAERYAASRAGEDPRFTKFPATWLRAGSWDDEPAHTGSTPKDDAHQRTVNRPADSIELPSGEYRTRAQIVEAIERWHDGYGWDEGSLGFAPDCEDTSVPLDLRGPRRKPVPAPNKTAET